jgi:ELWxxDGT repeat protein
MRASKLIWSVLGIVATMFFASAAGAANPYFVKDINPTLIVQSSHPQNFIEIGGVLYFSAVTPGNERELWKSDGTAPGTVMVKDINPGPGGSYPGSLTNVNGTMFFYCTDAMHGEELWKSDGTAAGTIMVKDINPGVGGSSPRNLTKVNGTLFFTVYDTTYGNQLWKSDGTATGTVLIKVINPGGDDSSSSQLTNVNGILFFQAADGSNGYELWKSDGTATGTVMVKDINPGVNGSYLNYLTNVNGTLLFAANDGANGYELWKSDGTTDGTVMVKDISAGGSYSSPGYLTNVNGTLFFTADDGYGRELWKSDGTADGTVMVKDINPGAGDSTPVYLTDVNGTLFFAANDGTTGNGTELWRSDGTTAGTVMVKDIAPGASWSNPTSFVVVNGTLFFAANDGTTGNGTELWRSDGTSTGTVMVKDIYPGLDSSNPQFLTNVNGTLFFAASDVSNGYELWRSNGTASDTIMVTDLTPKISSDSTLLYLTDVNGTLFFKADDGINGAELWKSDGTAGGTVMVKDIYITGAGGSSPANLTNVNGTLYFTAADDGVNGIELWKSDGTTAGTVLVKDIYPGGPSSGSVNLTNLNGSLVFQANDGMNGSEIWKSDGTAAGTVMLKDIFPGTGNSAPANLINVNGTLYFSANDGTNGTELWKSDGTAASTVMIKDINTGSLDSSPANLTNVDGILFFSAYDGTNGTELWKSDGTDAGTALVKDIYPGAAGSSPENLTNVNGTLFFIADDGTNGSELWKSDGTAAGTVMVKDVYSGAFGSYPAHLTNLNGTLYFFASDGTNGTELWKSDGTTASTVLVKDINPGPDGSRPYYLTNANGTLFFGSPDGTHGFELWKSNGTAAGTVLARDIHPGVMDSFPDNFAYVNGTLFFVADDGTTGRELFAYQTAVSINANSEFAVNQTTQLSLACPLTGGCTEMILSNDCVFDTEQWQAFSTSVARPFSEGDGQKKVCVKFRDGSGSESAVYSDLITLDTTPPDTTLTSFPAATTTATATTFTFSSPDPTATFQCWLDFDLDGYQTCTSPATYILYQGSHILRVRAVDPAGNIDPSPVIFEWTIIDNLGGSAFGWGGNVSGQLGIGTSDYNAHPIAGQVNGPIGFIQIDTGQHQPVALRNDGTVWFWGEGLPLVPTHVPGIAEVKAVDAGTFFTLALKQDGTVWVWGRFLDANITEPQQVLGIDQVIAVSAGDHHAMALRQDGTVWVWGRGYYGELGLGSADVSVAYPTIVPGLSGVTSISAGELHSLAIRGSDGRVLAWGWNGYGQLGSGDYQDRWSPTAVMQTNGSFTATKITASGQSSAALDVNGNFWAWGNNQFGNLGLGDSNNRDVPTSGTIAGNAVIDIATSYTNTAFLTAAGTVWVAGANWYGQIGRGLIDNDNHPVPEKVAYLSGVYDIAVPEGGFHLLALKSTWIAETIDTDQVFGLTSLSVDPDNNPHITYITRNTLGTQSMLGYMTNAGGAWQKEILPLPSGMTDTQRAAIALDSGGKAHVCAGTYGETGAAVYYYTNKGGSWTYELVESGLNEFVIDCDIALRDDDTVYISYFSGYKPGGGQLRVAWLTAGGGLNTISVVDDGCATNSVVGFQSSLAVDTDGHAHISYFDATHGSLKYVSGMVNPLSFGTPSVVDDLSGTTQRWSSIALNGNQPSIGYVQQSYVGGLIDKDTIKYAKLANTVWTTEAVDTMNKLSEGISLVFVAGLPYISYYDSMNEDLKVAYHNGSRWVFTAVDTDGRVGQFSSIAVDSMNTLHVSYWDNTTSPPRQHLKYATNVDATRPTGGLMINNGSTLTKSASVQLNLTCGDGSGIGCWQVVFSSDGIPNIDLAVPFAATMQYTLPTGDGPKTVYANYRDAANNWSIPYNSSIILDTLKPTGTIAINAGSSGYAGIQNVTLTLSASDTNGIALMQFSNDNINWSTPEAYSTSRAWALASVDGVKTIHARFQDPAGNWSDPVSAAITLDTTAPTTTATPGGGSYSSARAVTLTCSDGSGVDGDGTNGTPGCAAIYYSLDGTPPTTPYSLPFTVSRNLTLKFKSVDSLGNSETVQSTAYSFFPGYTLLSMDLSAPTIPYNDSINIYGSLHNMSGNNATLAGEQVTIKIVDPDGIPVTPDRLATLDMNGQYGLYGVSGFTKKGPYTIKAEFAGASLLLPSTSPSSTLLVGASAGYVILIEGKIANDPDGLKAHNKTANRIYQKLRNRAFDTDNIYYFNYDRYQTGVGVDALPNKTDIQDVIENWASPRMNANPAPLYIIMVDHGNNAGEFIIGSEKITAADLSTWLGTLEGKLTPDAKKQKRVIINGSCYSGKFISALSMPATADNAGRMIISSAAPDEVSYKGPYENDGRSGEFFLEELFTQLEHGETFKQAFIAASEATRIYTQKGGASSNGNAPYFDGAVQHPLLDDNGDGQGSNALYDGALLDGEQARHMELGAGNKYSTNSAQNPVAIDQISDPVYLDSSATGTLLWARVNDNDSVDSAVWMEIRRPTQELPEQSPTSTIQADVVLSKIPMLRNNTENRWERDPSDPLLAQDKLLFDDAGRYEIFYFVRDVETQKLAPMKRSLVYKDKQNNQPPPAPTLDSPADATTQKKAIISSWNPALDASSGIPQLDPELDPFTYTLEIWDGTTIQYRKEELTTTQWAVGAEAGLVDGRTYTWKVLAVDAYGAHSASETRTFTVDDPNDSGIYLSVTVTDEGDNNLTGAKVRLLSGQQEAAFAFSSNGVALISNPPAGSYSIEVSCPGGTDARKCNGFSPATINSVQLAVNTAPSQKVRLVDTTAPTVTGFTINPATQTSLNVSGISIIASDNPKGYILTDTTKVKDYCLSETNDPGTCSNKWNSTNPTSFTFGSGGNKTLYAFTRDYSSNVSASRSATTTINIAVSNPSLDITIAGSGSGTVYSNTGGIACIKGSTANCSATYTINDPVTLIASPDWKSTFGGWSNGYIGSTTPVGITMNTSKAITATFTANIQAQVGGTGYASLQEAYNAAANGATIQSQVYNFLENLALNRPVNIIMSGGLNSSYQPTGGFTTIQGSLSIEQGSVVVDGVAVH